MSLLSKLKKEIKDDVKSFNICVSSKPCERHGTDKKYEKGLYIVTKYSKLVDLNILKEISYNELRDLFFEELYAEGFWDRVVDKAKEQNNIKEPLVSKNSYYSDFEIKPLRESGALHRDKSFSDEENDNYYPDMQMVEMSKGFLVFYFNPDNRFTSIEDGQTYTEDINGNRHLVEEDDNEEGGVQSGTIKFASAKEKALATRVARAFSKNR